MFISMKSRWQGSIALCVIIAIVLVVQAPAAERPNLVYILADDLGMGDLGCYNSQSKIPTPAIDGLARDGMRFNDAHSPSAVCTPTRYGVLTGRYAWRTRLKRGVLLGYSRMLIEPGRLTVASLLQEHGYETMGIGKWHLGLQAPTDDGRTKSKQTKVDYSKPLRPGPLTVGFASFFGIPASLDMDPYLYIRNDRPVEQPSERIEKSEHRRRGGGGYWRGGAIAPGFRHEEVLPTLAREAVAFIESQKSDRPFFLYFPLNAPHTPWVPTKENQGRSKAGYYGDFVAAVDEVVKQVTDALDRAGLAENTIVMLTSDNGSHWPESDIRRWQHDANNGFRGQKADIHEGGHRVPLVVRWPKRVRKNSVSDQIVCLTDLTATMARIVGHNLSDDAAEDSVDMLPALIEKADATTREAIVHHSFSGMFAIRQGDWKLIEGLGSGGFTNPRQVKPKPGRPKGQLYNLAKDPTEKENLYQQRSDVVNRLHDLLVKYKSSGRSR